MEEENIGFEKKVGNTTFFVGVKSAEHAKDSPELLLRESMLGMLIQNDGDTSN